MTPEQIKKIQFDGIDWLGNPLKVDGLMGPKTEWWHAISQLSEQRQDVLKLALGYHTMGMGEDRNNSIANDGTFVDMLLKPVRLKHQPWCLAFCSHVYWKCTIHWPAYVTGAKQLVDLVKAGKQAVFVDVPLPGDIEVFLYPLEKGNTHQPGHGRIVTGYDPKTGETAGVDGNVGDAVRVGRRRNRPERYFVRAKNLGDSCVEVPFPKNLMYLDNLVTR